MLLKKSLKKYIVKKKKKKHGIIVIFRSPLLIEWFAFLFLFHLFLFTHSF